MSATLITATTIITSALDLIGAYGVGESLSADDAASGLRRLNAMMSSWAIQPQTIPVIRREVFDVVANQSTYTIGSGADFNTSRPSMLTNAALLLNTSSPAIEIPIAILTDDMYAAIAIKTQTNVQFTSIYYNPTFTTSGWGTIFLWPVPTTAANDVVIYRPEQLSEFTNLTAQYQVPNGYEEALSYNLAARLAAPFGRPLNDDVRSMAKQSLANIKRQNTKMSDLYDDTAALGWSRWGYNINTDQGG